MARKQDDNGSESSSTLRATRPGYHQSGVKKSSGKVAAVKPTAKSTPRKKSASKAAPRTKSSARKSQKRRPLWLSLFRVCLVLGIWVTIGVGTMIAWYAAELPKITEAPQLRTKNAITVRSENGVVLARYGELKGVSTPVSELPEHLIEAVLATEDRRFYKHFGLDPLGIARAMIINMQDGRASQGGSTITQQLAKNLFLSADKTFKRKVQEALLSLWIERHLTKDEILSAYLNRVYMGSGTYGVEAASEVYFSKSAKDLSVREAATIAGLLKAPSRYSPLSNPKQSALRTNVVLAAMQDAGYITKTEANAYVINPQGGATDKPPQANTIRHFTDWVTGDLKSLIGTPDLDVFVTTTIDPDIQRAAELAVGKHISENAESKKVSQAAMIILDYDGAIVAMVGGVDYRKSQYNRAAEARRQPGSSFKPFVYLNAIQHGYNKDTLVMDSPFSIGKYSPSNYNGEYFGEIPLKYALAFSLNTVAVQIAHQFKVSNIIDVARAAGIRAPLHPDLSLALGTAEVPMIEMVNSYATIARDGFYIDPYAITSVKDKDGRLLYQRSNIMPARHALDKRAVRELKEMMALGVQEGTGRAAQGPYPLAGKTGTSQEFRDAWFIGFTDRYIAAVWVGNDNNTPMRKVTGGSIPARIFKDTMTAAHGKNRGISQFSTNMNDLDDTLEDDFELAPINTQIEANDSGGQFNNFLRTFLGSGQASPNATNDTNHENKQRYN
jgi:penicillin-binding protein 1A